jgi:enoyl-CoA hydratase/carnithine racemase
MTTTPINKSPAELKVTRQGPIAVWTISNPDAKNALSPEIYAQGLAAIEAFNNDTNLAVAVLCGEDGFFCAGGNLNRLLSNRSQDPSVQRDSIQALHNWISAIHASPKPIVAAVDGAAAGAGFSLALACDLLVASPTAKFVMAYVNVGLTPDGGSSKALAEQLPSQLAFEICALGERVTGERLFQLGVVNRLSELAESNAGSNSAALISALSLANQLAEKPPEALAKIKKLIRNAKTTSTEQHLLNEREAFVEQVHGPEALVGIQAFLAKQKPKFR